MPDRLRLYLDQMFGLDVAAALRREGHDVLRAAETGLARADDALILEKAIREERILVTLDEHFGDWVILPLKTSWRHSAQGKPCHHSECCESSLAFLTTVFQPSIQGSSCYPLRGTGEMGSDRNFVSRNKDRTKRGVLASLTFSSCPDQ